MPALVDPHPYEAEPGDLTVDWSGQPAAACRHCGLPRRNSVHRRPRQPRAMSDAARARVRRRQELLAATARELDAAVLGERDEEE